jgi:hypothetical protein
MAYGQKYQSDFYNLFKQLVSVKIYERDYVGSVTNVRTSRVEIKANYQDDNTPIIGSGATIVMIATTSEMSYLEDMLTSYERQFMCTIEYEGQIVFRGYSISDLNERQFLQYAEVTMQFTDYLHRMEEYYPARLRNVGGYANVFSLIQELLTLTGLDLPIYINSSLFETTMTQGANETFLTQIIAQNSQFYADLFHYDNIYDAVNKCLQPFNAYLYYYNEKWIIERLEDIVRSDNWVLYEGGSSSSTASLKQEYSKQAGDWEYVDMSQVIEYTSGLKMLILQLQDKKIDSIVFNNYTEDMLPFTAAVFPDEGDLLPNIWYKDADITGLYTGVSYLDLETYFHFNAVHPDEVWIGNGCGIYYNFNVTFPVDFMTEITLGMRNSFNLSINYKATTDSTTDITNWKTIVPRFLLRLDGGPYSGWWVKWIGTYINSLGQSFPGPWLMLCAPEEEPMSGIESLNPGLYFYNGSSNGPTSQVWNVDRIFDLNKQKVLVYWRSTTMNFRDNGLWDELGNPEFQRFTIIFLPTWYWINDPHQLTSNFIGDITVLCTTEDVNNKIEYYINEDFYRTETIDLYLFDLPNPNYSNGLMLDRGFAEDSSGAINIPTEYTKLWVSQDQVDPPAPLYEIFAKTKFRKYGRTNHKLKAKILSNNALKVFSVLTDENMPSQEGGNSNPMDFILNGFTWDVVNGTYDIEAEEYNDEDVIVEGLNEYDSEGQPIDEELPPQVTGLTAHWVVLIYQAHVSWQPVAGAVVTGYKLQRKPFYHIIQNAWGDDWWLYYTGTSLSYVDNVPGTGPWPPPFTVTYRVCAYNDAGDGPWSDEFELPL